MPTASSTAIDLSATTVHLNRPAAELVEMAIRRREGVMAANGAINCMTGERTGRSPKDKFLEDTPGIHDKIWWGTVNRPLKPAVFDTLLERSVAHLQSRPEVFEFRGFAGADPKYRLGVRVLTEKAWHSLFAQTLFIRPTDQELASFKGDWTVINACGM